MLSNHPRLKNLFALLGIISFIVFIISIIFGIAILVSVKKVKNINNQKTSQNLNNQVNQQKNQGIAVGEFNPNILINNLSDEQKKILKNFGIDETNIPTSISKEQEECALKTIGTKRLNQIISGSTPTVSELLKAKSCI